MNQLELLWDYQQADVEVEQQETKMKRSPTRQRLLTHQEYLRKQKEANTRLEEDVQAMNDRMDALKDVIERLEEQFRALQTRIEENPPADHAAVQEYIQETQRILQNIAGYEQEIKRIRKDANDRESQHRDILVRASKVRAEYDALKEQYDQELKEDRKRLEQLRAVLAEKAKGIEPAYMDKYKAVKQHVMPPLAVVKGDQCSGCRMSLPSATVRSVRNGTAVECECGRLLIQL